MRLSLFSSKEKDGAGAGGFQASHHTTVSRLDSLLILHTAAGYSLISQVCTVSAANKKCPWHLVYAQCLGYLKQEKTENSSDRLLSLTDLKVLPYETSHDRKARIILNEVCEGVAVLKNHTKKCC